VVVVAQLQAGRSGHAPGPVQVAGERPPRRRGAGHLAAGEVDPKERVDDELGPQHLGVVQRRAPGGRVERLGNQHVARARPQPGGVEGGLELGDGAADEAGVLDPGVADLGQGLEGAVQVDGQLVAEGEQLDADVVARHPVAAVTPGACRVVLGERRGGQGARGSGDRGGGDRRAQEARRLSRASVPAAATSAEPLPMRASLPGLACP
jgi:hypothetical protein